jgi:hypothetical protein
MKKGNGKISVDSTRRSANKNGKFTSIHTIDITTDDTKMISQNKVKGDKGKYRSVSLKKNDDGSVSGNFVKGEKGKYITGNKAERKFSRISTRMNRKK